MKKEDKKAFMLTTRTIILFIILLFSFAIILGALWISGIFDSGETDKQICHSSIVARHALNYKFIDPGKTFVKLKCNVEKICVMKKGESKKEACPDFNAKTYIEVENKEDVLKVFADKLTEAHWIFGEGKLDFFKNKLTQQQHCLVSHRFLFSENVKNKLTGPAMSDKISFFDLRLSIFFP